MPRLRLRCIGRLMLVLLATSPASQAADVVLQLTFGWEKTALTVPSAPRVSPAGQSLRFTRIAGLLSEIALVRSDGTSVQLPGQFGFFSAADGHDEIRLTGVPPGDYRGLRLRLGVPPKTNHANPAQWPADHPLNPLVNGLHWGWTGGYVFLAVEGRFGTASAAPDTLDQGFSFHLATDELALPVRFSQPFSIVGDSRIHLLFDLADWWGDLVLDSAAGTTSTHSRTGDPLARQLADRVGSSWWFGNAVPATLPTPDHLAAPSPADPLLFEIPAGWPQPELPADNLPTADGVALGAQLFRDPRLSGDATQSCADCHRTELAFSDEVPRSLGIHGQPGTRNAMPLFNLAWSPHFAWDGAQPRIRDQALTALTNPLEMDGDPTEVIATLSVDEAVRTAFAAAFGDPAITPDRIGRALEQFLLTLVSADSKFDRMLRGEVEFTAVESRGLELFNREFDPRQQQFGADCFHCHGGALFTDYTPKNNGLDLSPDDPGFATVTGHTDDLGKFKTPSLRNIALTSPYMHDGRFATLADVITHYVSGVQRPDQLDPNLAKHPGAGVPLSPADQAALLAFLHTLTDPQFLAGADET